MSSRERQAGVGAVWSEAAATGGSGDVALEPSALRVPDRIILSAQIGLDRLSYEALERAEVEILEDETHTLAVRLLAAHTLVSAAIAEYGRGAKTTPSFAVWMEHMNAGYGQRWLYQEATSTRAARAGRRRMVLSPLISCMETRCGRACGRSDSVGGFGSMLSLAAGRGRIYLPSIGLKVDLGVVERAGFKQDSPALRPLLVRYLVECLRRRALLQQPNLLKGVQHLLVRYALLRWYASALASARGVVAVGVEELREAVGVVERYHEAGDQPEAQAVKPPSAFLVGLALDMVASPADLVANSAR